jgi:hypothetical protein
MYYKITFREKKNMPYMCLLGAWIVITSIGATYISKKSNKKIKIMTCRKYLKTYKTITENYNKSIF